MSKRPSNRFVWLAGFALLIAIAVLVACGTTYKQGTDGLVLVGSQGSAVIQTFSFGLANGHIASVYNSTNDTGSETCALPGQPASMLLDPTGTYAYVILEATAPCAGSQFGIQGFQVNSDGTLKAVGSVTPDPNPTPNPVAMTMDSKGQFLFVAEGVNALIDVYSISSGNLTPVGGFATPSVSNAPFAPNLVALAITPTVFPAPVNDVNLAECSSIPPPTAEYLYTVDQENYLVWMFTVNTSTGALTPFVAQTSQGAMNPFLTDPVPAGIAVDACNRFVYVTANQNNKVDAFTMCNGSTTESTLCTSVPQPAGYLEPVTGSPFSMPGTVVGPGPLVVDPYGNQLYVISTSNNLTTFHISQNGPPGSLTPGNPSVVSTGQGATAIAIRSDDNWLFVTNYLGATISQYSITQSTGAVTSYPPTATDNYPFGVAVK